MSFVKSQELKNENIFLSSDDEDYEYDTHSVSNSYASNAMINSDKDDLISPDKSNIDKITTYSDNNLSLATESAILEDSFKSKRNAKKIIKLKDEDLNELEKSELNNNSTSNKSIIAYDLIKRMMKQVKGKIHN
jgi:hypothetical protein